MKKREIMSSKFFDSRCRASFPDKKEKVLGYLLGPIGGQLLYFLVSTWLNVFYTDVLGLTDINPDFLFYFPLLSGILVVITNLLIGYLIDHTRTKQGKARPYIFLSIITLPLSGILLFLIPEGNEILEYCLICLSFNFFFSFSFAIYNSAYNLLTPLSSRNSKVRNSLSTLANLGMMIAQAVGSLFPTLIYPYIGTNKTLWFYAMAGISLLCLPFVLLQYYFTRERVSEETMGSVMEAEDPKIPLKKQLSAVCHDRYWWVLILYTFVFQFGLAMKNSSVAYYCNWVIGSSYNDGYTMLLFNIVGGLSLGVGALVIGPLSKKFSKQKLMAVGFIFYSLGSALCWVISFPGWFNISKNAILAVVLVGQIIKNAGAIPCVYIWMSMVADVLDHIEYKTGFRCDGITVSINTIFALFMPILGNAIVNKVLSGFGYQTPASGATSQNTSLLIALDTCAVGIEAITSIIVVILMLFLNVEKNLPMEQAAIQERQKEKVLASGCIYVSPEEKAQKEDEEFEKEKEASDLAAIKMRCDKKGLDYEEAKAKYFDKKTKKEGKAK
ncbi:MAG: MFS transporter [Bacilli bacterium]|jgi:GPH family glycoside/pentoside/hexuronide:cation symporter|nr:MFS transporter [Bacilli bacterium]MCH4210230.1 MFS transporter [Bacilli bacterium]MCH4228412.1 MFS transporter [Bacilli bacterium]MCH4278036.1 MFS transporter [Bacilli bacterium]MCI2054911.1 MFS transporter [Bacilli bacterium]